MLTARNSLPNRHLSGRSLDSNEEPLLGDEGGSGGSVLASALTLAKICIGSGVMALPWGFEQGGSFAVGGMVLIGIWNWYTSLQLVHCRSALANDPSMWALGDAQEGVPRSAYSALACAALGRPGLWLLEGSVIAVLTGVCASMQIQFAQFTASFLPALGYNLCVCASAVLLLPLVLQRTLEKLSMVSALGLLVLLLGLATVAVHGWNARGGSGLVVSSRLLMPPSLAGLAAFFGIATFSFGVQMMVLPVQEAMAHPNRVGDALALSLSAVVIIYVLVGGGLASLYASEGVQQLVILNLPPGTLTATAVEACAGLVALLSYPLPLMPVGQPVARPVCPAGPPPATICPPVAPKAQALATRPGAPPERRLEARRGLSQPASDRPKVEACPVFRPQVVQLLLSPLERLGKGLPPASREPLLRLLLLAFTTATALLVPNFGAIAGFLGCLNVAAAQVMPPALHLKLVSLRALEASPRGAIYAKLGVLRDALLLLLGVATLLFFSLLTGKQLLAQGDRPAPAVS